MTTQLAIGLMSGTSLDGIDAALIETDGEALVRPIGFAGRDYDDAARATLAAATRTALTMACPAPEPSIDAAAHVLTDLHVEAVRALLAAQGIAADRIGVIGFHGQTIAHRPDQGWTWQIGNGARMADMLGIPVVADLRSADVAAGGQGAPLLPVYHRALCGPGPVAVLNLGGVGNLTWISEDDDLVAFDTGPANGLIDDWVEAETGARFDAGGALAAAGTVDMSVLTGMLDQPWFDQPPPKSLDRSDFTTSAARGLSAVDGAATLTRFTAETVALGLRHLPGRPRRLIVAGGGRHNPVLMAMIGEAAGLLPEPIEALGRNGDATEAEGFAYMAVRRLRGLPISFPGTTGVPRPMTGGVLYVPARRGGGMIRAGVALMLVAAPAAASTPSAWGAMHRAAGAACIKASGLGSARASPAIDFSDDSARTVLLVTGIYPQHFLHGAPGTMLCLYDRRTKRAETVEAKAWRVRPL